MFACLKLRVKPRFIGAGSSTCATDDNRVCSHEASKQIYNVRYVVNASLNQIGCR